MPVKVIVKELGVLIAVPVAGLRVATIGLCVSTVVKVQLAQFESTKFWFTTTLSAE